LDNKYLSPEIFSIIVGVILVTTLITPPMLRAAFSDKKGKDPDPQFSIPDVVPEKETK
jgi:hypothetical protein